MSDIGERSFADEGEGERRGVGPWEGEWPVGDQWDPELLENGDYRNVEDEFRYMFREAIREKIAARSLGFEVAIENLGHDFNIGSIVRTANALGVSKVHIVGRRRWNRRGAMVTDRYLNVVHHPDVKSFLEDVRPRHLYIAGIDNRPGSEPIEASTLPRDTVLVMGEESAGLSDDMVAACDGVFHITQYGSTRSMNVGHAAAIAMFAWSSQHIH
ncbi:TrmH family RNA methyltransferase [Actinomyces minihominis]|uniref:TrmH family RNA methyltransferase n=1 Tax=Actinomyces minihominis TaxID=2002838 RepID=UPI000C0866F5|nr:RNA methyltransferase [Actinomyces minihominis]